MSDFVVANEMLNIFIFTTIVIRVNKVDKGIGDKGIFEKYRIVLSVGI